MRRPSIESENPINYYFTISDGRIILWKDLELAQKQTLLEALINIKLLYRYINEENITTWDNLIKVLIDKIVNSLNREGLELNFANDLNRCNSVKLLREVNFPQNFLDVDIDVLKKDIEREGSSSFMPNLMRNQKGY